LTHRCDYALRAASGQDSMASLILGIVLLLAGIGLTVSSPNTIFYGAIVVGIINIIRGAIQLSQEQRHHHDDSHW
jgi:uncharacterized membrane protein HdeD (DUF308 family)